MLMLLAVLDPATSTTPCVMFSVVLKHRSTPLPQFYLLECYNNNRMRKKIYIFANYSGVFCIRFILDLTFV